MKRPMKVMLLVHPQMRPDRASPKGPTESDVWRALKQLGCAVEVTALENDLEDLDRELARHQPQVVFNLLEEFRGEGIFDFHPVSFLEARGVPFTGCNPRGLIVSRNKSWAVNIARGLGIDAPEIFGRQAKPRFPAFIKYNREHASRGLTKRSRVVSARALSAVRRSMTAQYAGEISIQEFIPGEDVTVSVLGNSSPRAFAPWRLSLNDANSFATERIKFSAKSRQKRGIRAYRYDRPNAAELRSNALRLFAAFDLSGYARLDFRVTPEGRSYFIDVNANPNLARGEDFECAARHAQLPYPELIDRILHLARNYRPRV